MPSQNQPPGKRFRVAVVGCGAVTRASLLPVLAGHDRIEVVALVDRDVDRARGLAASYGVPRASSALDGFDEMKLDGVVLATPPAHHAPATLDLLARGHHVFVEKPMATRLSDAQAMVEAADRSGLVLSVGLYRRLLPVSRLLRGLLDSESFGRPVSIDIEEGGEYTWELATLSVLTQEGGGGGVLIDLGTHLIDQLFFVLPGHADVTRYAHNARGGIETDCVLDLELLTRWGAVPVRMELSRTRQLRGTIRVTCERGTIELMRGDFCSLRVHSSPERVADAVRQAERPLTLTARWGDEGEISGYQAFRAEIDDWLRAVDTRSEPQLSGRSVLPVIKTIDECYRLATPLDEPWVDHGIARTFEISRAPSVSAGTRPRVLVTGAGGFLGGRTAECLYMGGAWDVRAMVRRPTGAARLARFPIELIVGDITSESDVAAAVRDCDAVVHCAVGTGWPPQAVFASTVGGAERVAEGALAAGVKRFVHISSMAVHGSRVPPRLDESVALDPGAGFAYGRAKYLAEQAVAERVGRGLNAVILRPARIYGPFSRTFTTRPLQALREGRLVLAGDAETPSNMVYVDNVVEAIIAAVIAPDSVRGEAFLISEPDQLSWRAFYESFAQETGATLVVRERPAPGGPRSASLPRRWVDGVRQIALSPELRGLAKRVLATDPVATWPRRLWDRSPALQRRVQRALGVDAAVTYRAPAPTSGEVVEFVIDPTLVVFEKASTLLGFKAVVARDEGLALTRAWARAARLL